jgi:hypothetical protein
MGTWKQIITTDDDASYSNGSIDAGDLPNHSGGLITSGTVGASYVATLNQSTTGNAATSTKISSITNSNIVQLAATQTLTNKSIAYGQITSAPWTTNTGTVTSVTTSGTVSGITLTGSVTTSGALTLGGTLSLGALNTTGTSANVTGTVAIGNGGTGETTAAAIKNLLNVNTSSDLEIDSLGIGTAASSVSGEIRAINEVTAYYGSDISLKENINPISNPLEKLMTIGGYNFDWKDKVIKDRGGEDGFFVRKNDVGILAQEIEKVIPEIVVTRKDGTKAVKYEKIIPLLIESVKEIFRLQDKWNERIEVLEDGNR